MINIDELIKQSLKSGNKTELKTYRNLKAEFQKVRTAKNALEWNDKLEMQIISKYSRILEDAILQFSEAHRDDLVASYISELEVVKKLLPEPVTAEDIYSFIENDEEFFDQYYFSKFIGDNDETVMVHQIPKKDMGKAIKYLKSKFPQVNGKEISDIVKKYIYD